MTEEWRPVSSNDRYEVSSLGRIRSLDRIGKKLCRWGFEVDTLKYGKVLAQYRVGNYWGLRFGLRESNVYTHRIVAAAFIPNPENKRYVNHKNGDKSDNRVENLEWVTPHESMIHSTHILGNRKGQFKSGSNRNTA